MGWPMILSLVDWRSRAEDVDIFLTRQLGYLHLENVG
jgi:hypothetical protein